MTGHQTENRMGVSENTAIADVTPGCSSLVGEEKEAWLEPLTEPEAGQPNSRTLKAMLHVASGNE